MCLYYIICNPQFCILLNKFHHKIQCINVHNQDFWDKDVDKAHDCIFQSIFSCIFNVHICTYNLQHKVYKVLHTFCYTLSENMKWDMVRSMVNRCYYTCLCRYDCISIDVHKIGCSLHETPVHDSHCTC